MRVMAAEEYIDENYKHMIELSPVDELCGAVSIGNL
jgi:hypothetical protein